MILSADREVRVGADIGGTFTDIVLLDADGGVVTRKVPSTPDDHGQAILQGIEAVLSDRVAKHVRDVVHGTTVATNTIIERRGAPTGLLTTRGFRDALEIGRLRYPRLYDLSWSKPVPLVERRWRLEVLERLDKSGGVLEPLDEDAARDAIRWLRGEGIRSVAVCLLHSFRNPAHEQRIARLVAEEAPEMTVCLSSEVLPELGEFERTSTTVINAYVQPVIGRYLTGLESGLRRIRVRGPLRVMQSSGGIMSSDAASRRPIHVVESGPAAGVIAAQRLADGLESRNVITLDMGGTTAKAAILENGQPQYVSEYEVGGQLSIGNRLSRGAGYVLRAPAIDIAEVGAGGGSLVWLDSAGAVHVGPRSAGSVPGPVCYGAGGLEPTLTDVNLLLGYLNQHALLSGALAVHVDRARDIFQRDIAEPTGLPLLSAAYGVHRIAVASMVRVVKGVSSERGRDPRTFSLVAFGGNGPVHAALVAAELGMRRIVVPPSPGLFSAFGLLDASLTHHFSRTVLRRTGELAPQDLEHIFRDLELAAGQMIANDGYTDLRAVQLERTVDARYAGQSFALRLPMTIVGEVEARFGAEHERTYGHRADNDPVEIVTARVTATLQVSPPALRRAHKASNRGVPRMAYFGDEYGSVMTPVIGRHDLTSNPQGGPLIIEEYDATTVVPPRCAVWCDSRDNLIIDVGQLP